MSDAVTHVSTNRDFDIEWTFCPARKRTLIMRPGFFINATEQNSGLVQCDVPSVVFAVARDRTDLRRPHALLTYASKEPVTSESQVVHYYNTGAATIGIGLVCMGADVQGGPRNRVWEGELDPLESFWMTGFGARPTLMDVEGISVRAVGRTITLDYLRDHIHYTFMPEADRHVVGDVYIMPAIPAPVYVDYQPQWVQWPGPEPQPDEPQPAAALAQRQQQWRLRDPDDPAQIRRVQHGRPRRGR